jgi:hypothetical protein
MIMTHERHPVSDPSADRSWEPHSKCRDEVMNIVLQLLLDRGEASQMVLNGALAMVMPADIPFGTIRAYVSASLLHFAQAGWVESTERDGERSPIWKVVA